MEEFLLTHPEVIEQPPGSYALTGGRCDDPEVLPYPDVIPDATVVKPSCVPDSYFVQNALA